MEFLGKIFEYFIPTSRTLPAKTVFTVIMVAIVLFINDYAELTFHYINGTKISEMEKLNTIIKDTMTDAQGKKYALALRDEIMSHQSFCERTLSSLRKMVATSSNEYRNPNTTATANSTSPNNSPIKNNLVFVLTSAGVFIAFAIIAIPLMLIGAKNASFMQNVAFALITAFSFTMVGLATYALASLIPMLLKSTWLLNYCINILMQGGILYLFVRYNAYSKKMVNQDAQNQSYETFNNY